MRIEKVLVSSLDEAIISERIYAHMLKRGFKQSKDKSSLKFKRGSPGGSWGSFSPDAWLCKAMIDISYNGTGNKIIVTFGIDTRWQLVLPWEKAFWNSEIMSLEESIKGGDVNIDVNKVLRKAEWLNIVFVPFGLVIAGVIAAVVWFLPLLGIAIAVHRVFKISEGNSFVIGYLSAAIIAFTVLKIYSKKRSKQKPW